MASPRRIWVTDQAHTARGNLSGQCAQASNHSPGPHGNRRGQRFLVPGRGRLWNRVAGRLLSRSRKAPIAPHQVAGVSQAGAKLDINKLNGLSSFASKNMNKFVRVYEFFAWLVTRRRSLRKKYSTDEKEVSNVCADTALLSKAWGWLGCFIDEGNSVYRMWDRTEKSSAEFSQPGEQGWLRLIFGLLRGGDGFSYFGFAN